MEFPVTAAEILDSLVALGGSYLPAWRYAPGEYISSLTEIFAGMTAENRAMLPTMEERLRVLYLGMYGLEQRGAKPAVGFVRVVPTSENAVRVKVGTRLASEEHEFVTTSELYASGAEVKAVFSQGGGKLCRTPESFFDVSGGDLREEYICFSADSLLEGSGGFTCEVRLYDVSRADQHGVSPAAALGADDVRWEYLSGDGFRPVKSAEYDGERFLLTFPESVPESDFSGERGRWLRMSYVGGQGLAAYSEKSIALNAQVSGSAAEAVYFNDEKLPEADFLPFGREPVEYDALYLRSDECFSKSGARVTIKAGLTFEKTSGTENSPDIQWRTVIPASKLQPKPPLRKFVTACMWEYWNGRGWCRLFPDDSHSGDFADETRETFSMTFTCPEDIAPVTVGADEGLFIRCRVKEVARGWSESMEYVMPRADGFTAGFEYSGGIRPDCLYVSHDLALNRVEGELYTGSDGASGRSYTFICLDRALPVGYSSVYFRLGGGFSCTGLAWEAFSRHNGRPGWNAVSVSDRTGGLRESGMVAFSTAFPMEKTTLFGEEGFWLRAGADICAGICAVGGIYPDAVPVIQTAPQEEMSFVYSGAPLQLAAGGVYSAEVSVVSGGERRVLGEREYTLDRCGGRIIFDRGWQPELTGEPDVTVRYSVTDGAAGNVPAGSIDRFLDPVPFVDRVYNPAACYGGSDGESREDCVKRGAARVSSLGRCVSAQDCVNAALSADSSVRRAKCVSDGSGGITLALLTEDPSPEMFRLVQKAVHAAVSGNMPFYLRGGLKIVPAERAEVTVNAYITSDGEAYPQSISADIAARLREFLDPLTGGSAGLGFAIGEYPAAEEIRGVIAAVPHVKRIDSIQLLCRCGGKLFDYERLSGLALGVTTPGEPQLTIREEQMKL